MPVVQRRCAAQGALLPEMRREASGRPLRFDASVGPAGDGGASTAHSGVLRSGGVERVCHKDGPGGFRGTPRAVPSARAGGDGAVRRLLCSSDGDGALVFFGFPQANEDDLERAVRASLATLDAVRTIDGEAGRPLRVKIGIATGIAIVGDVVDIDNQRGLDAAGKSLNLAARLQELAEPDTVLITDAVRQLLGPLFIYRDLGMRAVKGWKEAIGVVQVLGPAAHAGRFEARTRHKLTPLIGRDPEVDNLRSWWAAARDGAGRVVVLTGEAGIGKSRLAAQLMVETELETHARLRWFAAAHQAGVPLHPCIQQIQHAAGLANDDPPELRRAKLESVLGEASEEDLVLIGSLLMADVDRLAPVLQSAPQRRRERTLQALLNWLVRICHRHPVLAVFEDAHWCDPTTAELLEMVVRRIGTLPLLMMVTARPEFRPGWLGAEQVENLLLRPLRPEEGVALIGVWPAPMPWRGTSSTRSSCDAMECRCFSKRSPRRSSKI